MISAYRVKIFNFITYVLCDYSDKAPSNHLVCGNHNKEFHLASDMSIVWLLQSGCKIFCFHLALAMPIGGSQRVKIKILLPYFVILITNIICTFSVCIAHRKIPVKFSMQLFKRNAKWRYFPFSRKKLCCK